MRSQREIYKSLLDGNTLISCSGDKRRIDFVTGFLVDEKGNKQNSFFDKPDSWAEYNEPQWYDKIPKEGVLCKLWSDNTVLVYGIVIKYENNKFIGNLGCSFENAVPVKPEECYVSNN